MKPINEVKMLVAKKGKTLTYLAKYLSEHSNKKYSLNSLSRSLHKETLKYSEMKIILEALDMQFEVTDKIQYANRNKKIIIEALSKAVKRLRGKKSLYILCGEYDITYSVLHEIEQANKDPQFTTIFKLAHAFDMDITEFVKEVQKEIPENLFLFDY